MRMAPTVTGSEHTVLRIDATAEGATNLAGGSKRRSLRKNNGNPSLNPVAHIFEPRTADIRPNFQQLRPPNHDSSDVLSIKERVQ
jgi:hypothetical protein